MTPAAFPAMIAPPTEGLLSAATAAADTLAPVANPPGGLTMISVLHSYVGVFMVAFVVAMLSTPFLRRLAVANGIVDRPSDPRKQHRIPIAYMGGVAVYLGLMVGILYSIIATRLNILIDWHPSEHANVPLERMVPVSILLGATIIMMLGLLDDIIGISPRLKIAGQLFAAAALAYENVGVHVAEGLIVPAFNLVGWDTVLTLTLPQAIPVFGSVVEFDVVYWSGAAIIAIGVIGGCNASNLIDGLDGLLTGVTAIAMCGLLVLALDLAVQDDGVRDSQRIILAMATLGACLGFLPHNFNPATIFLGDAGSMLLGYISVVTILSLGDTGLTHLVVAGGIIYAIPIIDTGLAIIRRKMSGKKMSDADANHLHHMLKRALGVKGAVTALYGIGVTFAVLGTISGFARARIVYVLATIAVAYIGVIAIKIARKNQIDEQTREFEAKRTKKSAPARRTSAPRAEATKPAPASSADLTDDPARAQAAG
ncbi:MAG: MraY family glycosyltransferase [Planctomycetota bacterium]